MILRKNSNRGIIRTLIIFFILLLVLAYFGFNIREIMASQTFQDNWQFVKESAFWIWENILKVPVSFLWNDVFVPLVWEPIIDNMKR